jgi:hypothetical protein
MKKIEKIAVNTLVIGLVVVGTALAANIGEVSSGNTAAKIFLFFVGAIIVLQVVPGLILFGSMIKELFRKPRADAKQAEAGKR